MSMFALIRPDQLPQTYSWAARVLHNRDNTPQTLSRHAAVNNCDRPMSLSMSFVRNDRDQPVFFHLALVDSDSIDPRYYQPTLAQQEPVKEEPRDESRHFDDAQALCRQYQ
eukprot:FR740497.1.p1 GENE.FR740497.1~~FR740497.1.p1  ORF type:complete len:111 (+),score=5.67 FR740497.1:3-335(+)